MSQQPDDIQTTVHVTIPTWMLPHVEKLNELLQDVRDMPRGGDLEGLIESHLVGLARQCYDSALHQRAQIIEQQASAPSEAFPPSGLPAVPDAAAARPSQAARGPEPAR